MTDNINNIDYKFTKNIKKIWKNKPVRYVLIIIIIFLVIERLCRNKKKTLNQILKPDWYKDVTKFPQKDFKCKKNCIEYNRRVKVGYKVMRTKRVIFAGLCINIEDKIANLYKRFTYIGQFFKDYKVIMFENDSKDNSRELLKQLSKKNRQFELIECEDVVDCKFKTISASEHGMLSENRMKKMANYRNRVLEYIKKYKSWDSFCIIDLDLDGPISIDGIAHTFSHYNDWDAISAYGLNGITMSLGKPVYYDQLAYKDNNLDTYKNKLNYLPVFVNINTYNVGDTIIKVQSGFAGLSFYKYEILNYDITYTPKDNVYKCEHIIFHENMIANGFNRIYINPNMLLLSGVQGPVNKYPFY